jgi:hypothetical protein
MTDKKEVIKETEKDEAIKEKSDKFTITNGVIETLLNAQTEDGVSPLMQFIKLRTISIDLSFKLEFLGNQLLPIHKLIAQKKMELIEKYGIRNEKGELIQEAPGNFKLSNVTWFQKEFNDLMKVEHEIDWVKVKVSRQDLPAKGLSGQDISVMRSLLDFVE